MKNDKILKLVVNNFDDLVFDRFGKRTDLLSMIYSFQEAGAEIYLKAKRNRIFSHENVAPFLDMEHPNKINVLKQTDTVEDALEDIEGNLQTIFVSPLNDTLKETEGFNYVIEGEQLFLRNGHDLQKLHDISFADEEASVVVNANFRQNYTSGIYLAANILGFNIRKKELTEDFAL